MSRPSKEQRHANKHAFFIGDFGKIQQAVRDTRIQCLSDRRFYSIPGAPWEGPVGELFENKPRFEFNKTHMAVLRIINEYRNNRITVDFMPKDGSDADELADTCDGLYRADEQDSGAQEAYDNAFEEGVAGGMGAIRLRARYEDEYDDDNDRQRICIEPVYEADTCVFFSLDGKRFDKADAKRCYVLTSYTLDEYADKWDDDPATWPHGISLQYFDWFQQNTVWVAEVYEVEEQSELIHFFRGIALNDDEPNEMELTDDDLAEDGKAEELAARGFREVRQKRRKMRKVHKWIMNGNKILSDEGYIAGDCIPIIPYYGKRWYVDGIERCQGHVRLARDAQMLDNMIKSWLAEMAARFDIEKPIFTPEQIAGHATMWAEDSIKRYPYLLINPILDPTSGQQVASGPIGYTKAPNLPPAMAALAQIAQASLEDMLGNQEAGEKMNPTQSGRAIELIQQRLDMQAFIYVDNFCKTIKRLGEVWLSMSRDLTVEAGRTMKTLGPNGEPGQAQLMRPMMGEDGQAYLENDMSEAKFDVKAEVGASSASRRAATVRSLSAVLETTTDPQTRSILTAMIMMNIEGEGLSDMRGYFRNQLVQMGAVKPTQDEQEQMAAAQAQQANQPPDAQTQYLQAAAENQLALASKAQKDGNLTDAKALQATADAIAKVASIGQNEQAHALDVAQAISEHDLSRDALDQKAQQQQVQDAVAAAQQQAPQTSATPAAPA